MKKLIAIALVALALNGCVPLMVGGYIGYKISQNDDHREWCGQHADDVSCHP
jgi:hypothetical protein